MKRLNTSYITSGIGMPIKSGTLDFLQDAHKETATSIITSLMGYVPADNTIYVLSGCVNSDTAPTYNVSAGIVYFNGEIYNVPAFNLTASGLNLPYPSLLVTPYTINADIVEFTDGTPRNVHDIRSFTVSLTDSSTYPSFLDWQRAGAWIYGDTKEVVCTNGYASAMFDSTGKGRLERSGWAIMNGNNGTPNDNGRVVVSYGTSYTTLGATGGSPTHTLLTTNLPNINIPKTDDYTAGGNRLTNGNGGSATLNVGGSSTPFDIMPPYVVRLRIMKI